MKRIVAILLCLVGTAVSAQTDTTLSPKMAAFKEYCERVSYAAGVCFTDILTECIEDWVPAGTAPDSKYDKFVYNKELINYVAFSKVECADSSQLDTIKGHFCFLPQAVDEWITNKCEAVTVADANMLRAGENHCECLIRALKPKGKAVYTLPCAARFEMFAVAEHGGSIGLSARVMEINFRKEIIKDIILSDSEGRSSAQLACNLERNGFVEFTIENLSDKTISFIVVKKL